MTALAEVLQNGLLAGAGSALALWIGIKRGFFKAPYGLSKPANPPPFLWPLFGFAAYIAGGYFIPVFLQKLLIHPMAERAEFIGGVVWTMFLTSLCILAALIALACLLPAPIRQTIWKRHAETTAKRDILFAIYSWLIAFPLVVFTGALLEFLVYLLFGVFDFPDQLAVTFLKMAFTVPSAFFLAAVAIVILTPIIEEFLFRGLLQSWLRRYFSPSLSIFLTASLFAAFHFAKDQGLGNIPILGSLWILGGFLGFLYERQGSLKAPIFLHAIFNGISVANLYFLGS